MKGILFNTEMVQAILDGRKTVTRRICKDANEREIPLNDFIDNKKRTYAIQSYYDIEHNQPCSLCERSMPICKGDILYVREIWKVDSMNPRLNNMLIDFKALQSGYSQAEISANFDQVRFDKFKKFYQKKGWQSPYFMPKEAARIFLRVTDVKVERLWEITEEQIWQEGTSYSECKNCPDYKTNACNDCANRYESFMTFEGLWDFTIKEKDLEKYGWNANPWVWVIEFERISKEVAYAERN